MAEPVVTPLFETPIIGDTIPDSARLNEALRHCIAEKRRTSPGVIKSNKSGWQSDCQMLRWGGEEAVVLARHFISLCERFTADPRLEQPDQKPFLWLLDMWANVSQPGASNEFHSHPGAVWSAVYYVDDGHAGADSPEPGGELVFQDARMPMTRMLPLDLRFKSPAGAIYDGKHVFRPVVGNIVMFPPWLLHCVREHSGPDDRISVAMNATAYQPN